MRRWFRKLIRNSFFQVGAGLFIVMIIGGFIIMYLETGSITEKETPFWWAIVTMTTVGYGDFSPNTPEGRLFAVFIMFAGIALVSLLTASISSIYVAKRIREDKGLEKVNISDHIILCGWNRNAESIIDSLRKLSESDSLHLILVNEIHEDIVNHLRNKYKDIDLYFVAGDFTSEEILKRASIQEAHTVIIIPNIEDEKIGSPDEKTIFATLTIKSLSSSVRVVAYLMQRENLTHIRRANVDEVVLSDDFGAYMLASHVIDPGIPQTTKGLLNASSKERLRRVDIPSQFVGRSFDDLFDYFRSTNGWILVGLYSEEENLGIGEVLSADSSALDAFIERKLNEGGISLQEESKVTTVINPKSNFLIEEGQRAIVIP